MNLRQILHEIDEAVFPSSIYCVSCDAMIDRSRTYSLCDDCVGKFHWITGRTCEKCGKAMPDTSKGRFCYDCMQEPHLFHKGFSCLTYGLYERKLMMDLKYAGKGYLAKIFGDVMFDRMEMEIREGLFSPGRDDPREGAPKPAAVQTNRLRAARPDAASPEAAALESDAPHVRIDLIVPVPVSAGRLRTRGYNQSAIMARQLAARWSDYARQDQERDQLFPAPGCRPDLLFRTRETQMLRSLNPTERRMALKNAFCARGPDLPLLEGKTVLLIDDIYTTGATADACSQALLEGGAADVYLLTLASGGNRRPGN